MGITLDVTIIHALARWIKGWPDGYGTLENGSWTGWQVDQMDPFVNVNRNVIGFWNDDEAKEIVSRE